MRPVGLALAAAIALWSSVASGQVRDVSELSEAQIQQVMTLIVAADAARGDGRCGEAIAQYREALGGLDADTVRFSLASCLEDVGTVQDAVHELEVVMGHADAELVDRAEGEIARLRAAHPAPRSGSATRTPALGTPGS